MPKKTKPTLTPETISKPVTARTKIYCNRVTGFYASIAARPATR